MAVWQDFGNQAIRELYPRSRDGVDYVWGRAAPTDPLSMRKDNYPGGMSLTNIQAWATYRMGMDPYVDYDTTPPAPPAPPTPGASTPKPDATNTGPRIALTNDGRAVVKTTAAGQTISGLKVTLGYIQVLHNNCSVIDCEINSDQYMAIDADNMIGTTISYCRCIGIGGANGIVIAGGTVDHCDITKFENGIAFGGANINIISNYIHGLTSLAGSPHFDGLQSGACSVTLIQWNSIDNNDTSNVFLKNDFGQINGVRVLDNWFKGDVSGNVCVYNEGSSGAPVINIEVGRNKITAPAGTGGVVNKSPGVAVNEHDNVVT